MNQTTLQAIDGYAAHETLHRQRGETLYFVRLYFEPVYPDIAQDLRRQLLEFGVGSAHVYELIGGYDVILRLWYDNDIRELIEGLNLRELRRADFMTVSRLHEHWALPQPVQSESPDALQQPLGPSDADSLCEAGLLAKITDRPGIKFFIVVTATIGMNATIRFNDVLYRHVSRILKDAGEIIHDRSIYAGDGFARLIVMGRFKEENYFRFMDQVVARLNDEATRDVFSARTVTFLSTSPEPMVAFENLAIEPKHPAPRHERLSTVALLSAGESQTVEIKATAFLNLDRWIAKPEEDPDWSRLRPEFAKAVCGLLNEIQDEQTILLVGAIEHSRPNYAEWLRGQQEPIPQIGEFSVIGVEEDNPSGDWDLYQRRLMDALDKAIEPAPSPYITAVLETIGEEGSARRRILRLELRKPRQPFYLRGDEKLFVRSGTQTKGHGGRQRDEIVKQLENGA
jgi:hypothetical protein